MAWRADLKNGLIFFIAMNFANCKQTADLMEMSLLRCNAHFDRFYVQEHKSGMKIIFVLFWAIFSDFKRFTKSAVARLTGLDTTWIQLLHGVEIMTVQNLPGRGHQRPCKIFYSLWKTPYFSTLSLSRGRYGLRRSIILVGDFEGTLMKGSR